VLQQIRRPANRHPNRAETPRSPRQIGSLAGILACGSLLRAAFPKLPPEDDLLSVALSALGYPHTVAGAAAVSTRSSASSAFPFNPRIKGTIETSLLYAAAELDCQTVSRRSRRKSGWLATRRNEPEPFLERPFNLSELPPRTCSPQRSVPPPVSRGLRPRPAPRSPLRRCHSPPGSRRRYLP
jgi:hypothetical protein